MKLEDLNGCIIEITDLGKAIEQAAYFKDLHHTPLSESDKKRQDYWRDLYEKLLTLKTVRQ